MDRSNLSMLVFMLGLAIPWAITKVSNSPYSMPLTQEEVRELVGQKTLLHIGGNHRSGTTFMWDGLQRHPQIASFGAPEIVEDEDEEDLTRSSLDADERERRERRARLHPYIDEFRSEGVFLQHTLPKFQLHHPYWPYLPKKTLLQFLNQHAPWLAKRLRLRESLRGLGEYAFDAATHLTEEHRLASPATACELFRQWALLWDLRRSVLMEKSPSNARIPRLLERLWGSLGGTPRFVFVTRHPLLQALAMKEGGFASEGLYELVEHWLAVEESLASDIEHLPKGTYKLFELSQVAAAPLSTLEGVFAWLGLEPTDKLRRKGRAGALDVWAGNVDSKPNQKYQVLYAAQLAESNETREEFRRILDSFSDRVAAVSAFRLEDWCLDKDRDKHGACPFS